MEPIFKTPEEARKCKLENIQLKRRLEKFEPDLKQWKKECLELREQNKIMFNAIKESLEGLEGEDLKPFSFIKGLVE